MGQIKSLQAGRAVAAIAVVVYHANLSANAFAGGEHGVISAILDFGYLGVDFFFVLSGFIIYYSVSGAEAKAPRPFLRSRLERIFAPYLPVTAILVVAYLFFPGLSAGNRQWGWVSTLTLLPTDRAPALSVAWTLQHEMVFYLLFTALLALRSIWWGMALWCASIVVATVAGRNGAIPISILFGTINFEFAFGMVAAWAMRSGRRISGALLLAGAAAAFLAFAAMGGQRELVGVGFAALVLLLCQTEAEGALRVPGWLVLLGDASYSIYLIHTPLISITSRLTSMVGTGWWSALCVGVAASIALGVVFHLAVERPILRWLRSLGQAGAAARELR